MKLFRIASLSSFFIILTREAVICSLHLNDNMPIIFSLSFPLTKGRYNMIWQSMYIGLNLIPACTRSFSV
uniref:Secreted protein n=1 Tax=Panstrongylus lignarius TaxID=156445 RepID=A0A224Y6K3_9HEMI